jgi:DNA-directed RNA polymerase subunit beta'
MPKTIICNKNFDKKRIKNLIEWFLNNYGSIKTNKLLTKIKHTGFKYSTKSGISLGIEDLLIPKLKKKLIKNTEKYLKKNKLKLIQGKINKLHYTQKLIETWNITNETLKKEIIKNFQQKDLLNPVYMMIFSGARGNLSQIKQLIGMRGLMADSKGEIIKTPIKTNLKEGLTMSEYFISCYGARKGIIDTALKTANSGYLTRRLIYVSQAVFIKQPDCNTKTGTLINCLKKDKTNYLKTKEKILGRVIFENIFEKRNKKIIISNGQDICNYIAKKLLKNQKYLLIRTCLNCKLNLGICQLCYGWNLSNNKLINIGDNIGVLAAQSIGEPGTQLTMRTFHTGGIFTSEVTKVLQSPINGTVIYSRINTKPIITKYGEKALISLREKIILIKKNELEIKHIKVPKSSIIFVKPNSKVFKKYIISEIPKWKKKEKKKHKENERIKTKNAGEVIIDRKPKNKKKHILWIKNGSLINNKKIIQNTLKELNKNKINKISDKKIQKNKLTQNKINFRNLKKIKTIFYYKFKKYNKCYQINIIKKEKVLSNKNENLKKIKVRNKLGSFITKLYYAGQITEERNKTKLLKKAIPYFINKDSVIKVKNKNIIDKNVILFEIGYEKQKTKDIVEGLPKVEEILEAKKKRNSIIIKNNIQEKLKINFSKYQKKYNNEISTEKTIKIIQTSLIKQIQNVYQNQGVNISNKHIEIIAKQMTSKVIIKESGDSNLLIGEIIELTKLKKLNQTLISKKITYEPMILGISKISTLSNSFISAACFQETIRVLTKSAIMGKIDWLKGLKENLILGNLIPTGTGYNL